ncbi:MAG: substrate-binding domain-containing protein [Anaerolineae bacterium]|nr:substrate-binding domain-containing protein [Anaerolineae bacterium]
MKRFLNSLAFKVSAIIILVEIIILAGIGSYYIESFNRQIDERTEARVELAATLIDNGLLRLTTLTDEDMVRELIGEELLELRLVRSDGDLLYSLNRDEAARNIADFPDMNPAWFKPDMSDTVFEKTSDGIISVSPLHTLIQAANTTHYVYFKIGTEQAGQAKQDNAVLFVLGSIATIIATSIVILLAFRFTIFNRIGLLLDVLERVEVGDLTARAGGSISSDEIGVLQRGVNSMVSQLEETVGSLEQRVSERSHALELSAEVSRRLSTILDRQQLIDEVVEQVRSAFDYYYTQIYLFDENRENLVLARGTGEAGQMMLARGHSLPRGRGLVGRAAERNAQVLVPDVYRSLGVEIITQENVADIYRRETDHDFEAQWYSNWLVERFGEIYQAKQLARQKPATDKDIHLGYVLHLLIEFTKVMKRGAEAAARDLRVNLEVLAPSQAYNHLPLFESLMAKGVDGLVVVPYGEQWPTVLRQAIQVGIPVVAANIASPLTGMLNVFQGNFQTGAILAQELTKFLVARGHEHGEIVLGPGIPDRIQGFKHGMRNTDYTIIQVDESVGLSGVHAPAYWQQTISEHPDLIAAVGLMSFEIPLLAELKRNTGAEWLIGGYDLELATIEAIQEGIVEVAIGQHPYLQGYLPVLALVEHLRQRQPLEGWMAEGWLPNPLLPETRAEMAVPISIGEQVLGVLDVQDNIVGSLQQEEVNLLQSIADQVAVGLHNAQLFKELEAALAETRATHQRYLEQSWEKSKIAAQGGQYHYTRADAPALVEAILVEARRQALAQNQAAVVGLNGDGDAEETQDQSQEALVSPVTLRDKTIGVLQLYPANHDQSWAEDDLAIVEAVADQLAQSAESLRLFEETRQRAGRESTIREITDKLRQAPTLEILARTASEELSKILGVSHSLVRMGVKETQPLTGTGNESAEPENGSNRG